MVINLTLKIGVLLLSVAMFRYAQKRYREQQQGGEWHIRQWTISLVSGAVVAAAGEYALSHGRMPPALHLIYGVILDGLILLAIYHGAAVTIEWTEPDRKVAKKRKVRRQLGFGGLCMMGLYVPYCFELQPLCYYAYNGVRLFLFVWFIRFSIIRYHRQAKATIDFLTRYRMYLMKYACCICLLFPLTVLPNGEHSSPRPNLVVSLCAGALFYLGYVTPKRFRDVLEALAPKLSDESRENLVLLSIISDFYNQRPTGRFLLEHWLKRFGRYLNLSPRQIDLLVLASYLMNSGRLQDAVPHSGVAASDDDSRQLLSIAPEPQMQKLPTIETPVVLHQRSATFTSEILAFREVGQIIHYVDERWDGRGTPDELRGREIPYESRVLSLMDMFVEELYFSQDAHVALEAVKAEDGRFDPSLVAALEEMLHQ